VRVLTHNTGKGQLEVLSVLTEKPKQRQSEVVENSSLSKGAVSNNVSKLREKDLIEGRDELRVNEERLLNLYREHLETFLVREKDEPSELNDLRTYTKKNISEIIENEELVETLNSILSKAKKRQDLESLNSVFKETDRVLRETFDNLEMKTIAITTDKSNTVTDNPEIAEEAQKILDEVKE
jgi:DNA-binding MarR family transcriptional regulator